MITESKKQEEWDYESYLTDSGQWYGKRCPAIVFEVRAGEQYQIEWKNCNTPNKYVYDMAKCGGSGRLLITPDTPDGNANITIPGDGVLYVGIGSGTNAENGSFNVAGFDGDYIRVRKE